jgi:AcrR family transcriptional regulator
MAKGAATRQTILSHAGRLATQVGLEGVTIGRLAIELSLSKSGLFAHFRSKEELQLQTIEHQQRRFVETVVAPVLATPGGEPRVMALFERWMAWRVGQPGGCFFAAASFELDDRPGPVRDRLADLQREWLATIARIAASAVKRGAFRSDLEPEMWAHEFYGMMLSYHLAEQLLRDPNATERTRRAFGQLLARSRATAAAA